MRKFLKKRRRSLGVPEVTLTPLIDTALTLLVIFMVTAPLVNNAIRVNLPSGKAQEDKTKQQQYVVYVDEHEKLYFNGTPVATRTELVNLIKKKVGSGREQTVFVKGDTRVKYGNIVELVDEIKVVGGVSYVALATKRA